MNIKLRPLPVILSVAISSAVLFGGWFVYNSVAMENPLSNKIKQVQGVETMKLDLTKDDVNIALTLSPQASLLDVYQSILKQGASIIGNREVHVSINNKSSLDLDQLWESAMFDVAQAMETKHYSDIPATLKKLSETGENITFKSEMDLSHVYIRLNQGDHAKFIILPRIPVVLGMWQP